MEELDKKVKTHLFICTRQRDKKACCSEKGAEQLVADLKSWVKKKDLKKKVSVSKSSCLGYCKTGITAVFYPQNQWFHHLEASDVEKLQKLLLEYAE